MTFDHAYHRWNLAHALVLTVGTLLVVGSRAMGGAAVADRAATAILPLMAAWSVAALGVLYAASRFLTIPARVSDAGGSSGRGHWVPDLLTAVRGIAAVAVLWTLPGVGLWSSETVWAVGSILAVVELTDFFDGRVARRFGPSAFGATWDMENDALFTLGLSLLVYLRHGVTPLVVLLGLMRYLYVLIWRFDRDPITVPAAYKRFAKTTAAAIVVTLLVTVAPIVPQTVRVAVLTLVLGMQVVSFGWDLVLQYQAVQQSGGLQ